MKERPILFNEQMVRQILADRDPKTQTRRAVKPQPVEPVARPLKHAATHPGAYFDSYCSERRTPENPRGMSDRWCWWTADDRPNPLSEVRCPFGAPGDRLWVREAFAYSVRDHDLHHEGFSDETHHAVYRATQESQGSWTHYDEHGKQTPTSPQWRPSIHMPRWASRITLDVTGVRVERLHAITEADAWAEGIGAVDGEIAAAAICRAAKVMACSPEDARATYGALWAEIYGAQSLVDNPWIWVVEFRRVESGASIIGDHGDAGVTPPVAEADGA